MTEAASALLKQVLALPPADRAHVAARVLESLDEDEDDPAEVEQAWRSELARRAEDVRMGRDPGIPADQVLAELKKAITSSS